MKIFGVFFPGAKTMCPCSCQNAAAHSKQMDTINKINNVRANISCEIEMRIQYSVKGKCSASLHIYLCKTTHVQCLNDYASGNLNKRLSIIHGSATVMSRSIMQSFGFSLCLRVLTIIEFGSIEWM